jgi:hypothetical protein
MTKNDMFFQVINIMFDVEVKKYSELCISALFDG